MFLTIIKIIYEDTFSWNYGLSNWYKIFILKNILFLPNCAIELIFLLSWCVIESISLHHVTIKFEIFIPNFSPIIFILSGNCNITLPATEYIIDRRTVPGFWPKCLKIAKSREFIEFGKMFKLLATADVKNEFANFANNTRQSSPKSSNSASMPLRIGSKFVERNPWKSSKI